MRRVTAISAQVVLLDTAEAALALGVHPKTLVRWVRDGKVRAMRTPGGRYRYRPSDLDAFVSESMTSGESQ